MGIEAPGCEIEADCADRGFEKAAIARPGEGTPVHAINRRTPKADWGRSGTIERR